MVVSACCTAHWPQPSSEARLCERGVSARTKCVESHTCFPWRRRHWLQLMKASSIKHLGVIPNPPLSVSMHQSAAATCMCQCILPTPAPVAVPQLIAICEDAVCRSTHRKSPPPPASDEPTGHLRGRSSWHRPRGPRSPPARSDPGTHWPRCALLPSSRGPV
jgi:hypothetical protein